MCRHKPWGWLLWTPRGRGSCRSPVWAAARGWPGGCSSPWRVTGVRGGGGVGTTGQCVLDTGHWTLWTLWTWHWHWLGASPPQRSHQAEVRCLPFLSSGAGDTDMVILDIYYFSPFFSAAQPRPGRLTPVWRWPWRPGWQPCHWNKGPVIIIIIIITTLI